MGHQVPEVISTWKILDPLEDLRTVPSDLHLEISNVGGSDGEVILDYGHCEGGVPIFVVENAIPSRGESDVPFRVVYSETREGIDHDTGDGPFFLFSNSMDTYRSNLHSAVAGTQSQVIRGRSLQASQRYQRIIVTNPNTTIVFSKIGFEKVRPSMPVKANFRCSNPQINSIWKDGVRTVDMCTVTQRETRPAWDITSIGTRVYGGHWAPCRQGTRWNDKTVTFETKIEALGASWGVHMVANGLILCLDAREKTLHAFIGLSNQSGTFPTRKMGSWSLPPTLKMSKWVQISTVCQGNQVTVTIEGQRVAVLDGVNVQPLLGGASVNTGSVAFGGPAEWIATYRNLMVTSANGSVFYRNDLMEKDAERTYADFQVGTNQLPCLIDGAKRDRACFGGDAFVTGRSIAYSTGDFETWRGSLQLLMSHQTSDGLLGNLCSIQAPEHDMKDDPPTYAFYSLTYALLLVVSVKDYWLHSGDKFFVKKYFKKMQDQMYSAAQYLNRAGLVEAPPALSMTWFPMGGPVFGPSANINLAYFDALHAMALMSSSQATKLEYLQSASNLQASIVRNLWDETTGVLRFSSTSPIGGICQSTTGYAASLGILPRDSNSFRALFAGERLLPMAFDGLGHWDKFGISSPYASGYALEALLARNEQAEALKLLHQVWGTMTDKNNPNYSGAYWEAMDQYGNPYNHDVSLAHGWSTWPVFLLPRYLAGLHPLEPGWDTIGISPVLAELAKVEYDIDSRHGHITIAILIDESREKGTLKLTLPKGTTGIISLPEQWNLLGCGNIQGDGHEIVVNFARKQ